MKIFANHMFDNRIVFKVYKALTNHKKKEQRFSFLKRSKIYEETLHQSEYTSGK